jgi:uncharacterized membrane protein YdjX (TVP38/TMEM64 family)
VSRCAEERPSRRTALLRLAGLAALAALAFLLAVALLGRSTADVRETVDGAGALAPVLYVLLMSVLTCALFPFPLLAAAGGLVFGIAEGTVLSVLGGTLGAVLAFLLARTVAGDAVARLAGERLERLQRAVEARGFVAVLYARIFPGVPRDLANYAFGLTRVGIVAFGAATLLGTTPRAYAYVALGGSLGSFDSTQSIVAISLLVGMGILGLVLVRADAVRGDGWLLARRQKRG